MVELIGFLYDWEIAEEMTKDDLLTVLQVGKDIRKLIYEQTGKDDNTWTRRYLGGTKIYGGAKGVAVTDVFYAAGVVPGYRSIFLASGFGTQTLAHELGHVLDNNMFNAGGLPHTWVGSGPADAMVRFAGGNPDNCQYRFVCTNLDNENEYLNYVAGSDPWTGGSYGNNSVADDFAEAFSWAIYSPGKVPNTRLIYILVMIQISVGAMNDQ